MSSDPCTKSWVEYTQTTINQPNKSITGHQFSIVNFTLSTFTKLQIDFFFDYSEFIQFANQ